MGLFFEKYLSVSQHEADPIRFPWVYTAPVNTGVMSGLDLDQDGKANSGPGDAYGFGSFPGQYGMALLSKFPIDKAKIRTFQKLKWSAMHMALRPVHPNGEPWYSDEIWSQLRLSSKSHWDVPIQTSEGVFIHVLASHPTPPVFDGPEDRNGRRNHDEIRFWSDYISEDPQKTSYIQDDLGQCGGLARNERFVILGDLNADPHDGDSYPGAVQQLLSHPLILQTPTPKSIGGAVWSSLQRGVNDNAAGPASEDTADFNDQFTGNLRVDYVLPSREGSTIINTGVFWPAPDSKWSYLVEHPTRSTSDHRMVWIDIQLNNL